MNKVCLFLVGLLGMMCLVEGLRRPIWPGEKRVDTMHLLKTRALSCAPGEIPNQFAAEDLRLKYYGGPTINSESKIYLYYYGNEWKDLAALQTNMRTFIQNLDSSEWYALTGNMPVRGGGTVTKKITFGGELVERTLEAGIVLTQGNVQRILLKLIADGKFPTDPNAQYYILNGEEVKVTPNAAKADYCGYHSFAETAAGVSIKYGFIVSDSKQAQGCGSEGPLDEVSNAAIGTMAHEIIETVSDPIPNDGYSSDKTTTNGGVNAGLQENADMCNDVNYPKLTLPNGKVYSVYIGPNPYNLFPNINHVTSCCAFKPPAGPPAASISASTIVGPPGSISASPVSASVSYSKSQVGSISNSGYGTYIEPSGAPTNTYDYAGYSYCGDGALDTALGEQCDPGYYGFGGASCCNFYCQFKVGSVCGKKPAGGSCYRTPRCQRPRATPTKVVCNNRLPKRKNVGCKLNGRLGLCNGKGTCVLPTST